MKRARCAKPTASIFPGDTWRSLLPYHQPDPLGRTWQEAAQSLQQKKSGMYLLGTFMNEQFPVNERNDIDFFTDVTPEERLAPVFVDVRPATVVCGHSHLQFERVVGATRIVNAGSVGMAYEDEPGAYWALLGPRIELRRSRFAPAPLAEAFA